VHDKESFMPPLGAKTLSGAAAALVVIATGVGFAQPPQADRGELRIEGTNISRLVLVGQDNHREEWSHVSGSLSLPAGTYRVQQIELQGGYSAFPAGAGALAEIVISPDQPAVLKAGGPLRQTVSINRRGSVLVLNYGLVGIGDEEYRPATRSQEPPSFTVYKGNRTIASGKFEYG
jgi:hypothetical protein